MESLYIDRQLQLAAEEVHRNVSRFEKDSPNRMMPDLRTIPMGFLWSIASNTQGLVLEHGRRKSGLHQNLRRTLFISPTFEKRKLGKDESSVKIK